MLGLPIYLIRKAEALRLADRTSEGKKRVGQKDVDFEYLFGSRMIDWEGLAQQHIAEIQRALPETIRDRATEVPVFFSRARDAKSGTYLGIFEGFSLMEGPPAQPDEMPRITLFIVTLAEAANHRRKAFLREVQVTYLHELGHYFGWDEGQIADVGLE